VFLKIDLSFYDHEYFPIYPISRPTIDLMFRVEERLIAGFGERLSAIAADG